MPELQFTKYILLAFLVCIPVPAGAGILVNEIDQCIKKVSRDQGKGNSRLAAEIDFHCPGLTERVNRSELARNLSWKFDSSSSISELRDVRQFLLVIRQHARRDNFRFVNVDQIVREVFEERPEPQPGLWERFLDWIRQLLPELDKEDAEKLDEFLKSISLPRWLNDAIFYGSGAMILGAAFWVLFREWRYYRRVGKYRMSTLLAGPRDAAAGRPQPIPLDSVPDLPLPQRAPAILRWVINHLESRGDLPGNHSMTNRELLRILFRQQHHNREYFSELVNETEALVYGNRPPHEERLEQLLAGARALQASPGGSAG